MASVSKAIPVTAANHVIHSTASNPSNRPSCQTYADMIPLPERSSRTLAFPRPAVSKIHRTADRFRLPVAAGHHLAGTSAERIVAGPPTAVLLRKPMAARTVQVPFSEFG